MTGGRITNAPVGWQAMALLAALCLACSAGCTGEEDEEAPPVLPIENLEGKIVCVGDSLTAAEGVPSEQSFTAKLGRHSERITVVQQGRSGWPTEAYLRRMDEVLRDLPADANVIIVQLGANDLRVEGHSDQTITRAVERMGRIIDTFRKHAPKAKIVVMAPPTMVPEEFAPRLRDAGFGPHSPDVLGRMSDAYRRLAGEKQCGFIDLFPVLKPGDTLDGAHPNDSGHTKIANEIWRRLSGKTEQSEDQ